MSRTLSVPGPYELGSEGMICKPALGFGGLVGREARLAHLKALEAQGRNKWPTSKSPAELESEALAALAALPDDQLQATLAAMRPGEKRAVLDLCARYK